MGIQSSAFSREELAEYTDVTYFSEGEIVDLFKKFKALVPNEEDARDFRVSPDKIKSLPEFKRNPFAGRMCDVFSSDPNGSYLSFDDFLDMMNVLSENASFTLKAQYAFIIFDTNDNKFVDSEDIENIVCLITDDDKGLGNEELTQNLITAIMKEADLDHDNQLGLSEFEHVLSKSPDFMNSFKIRL